MLQPLWLQDVSDAAVSTHASMDSHLLRHTAALVRLIMVLLLLPSFIRLQLYLFTRVLEFIAPELNRLSVGNILSDIKASMMDEVDFTKVCYFEVNSKSNMV
jgi:hypothetical protein